MTEELFVAFALGETVADCWKPLGPSYRIIKWLVSRDLATYLWKMLKSTLLIRQRFIKCLLYAGESKQPRGGAGRALFVIARYGRPEEGSIWCFFGSVKKGLQIWLPFIVF